MPLTRRQFLQVSAATTGAAAMASKEASAHETVQRRKGLHGEEEAQLIPSICEMCFWKCGIRGKVVDGKLVRIEGNPEHPLSKGRLCARGNGALGLLNDPDRIKQPMERVGPRGTGRFRPISWAKAFARVGAEFQRILSQHGPDALGFFGHGTSAKYPRSAIEHLGSHTISSASYFQCRGPREAGYTLTFGMTPGSPERIDLEKAKLVVLIGSHIGENVHVSQTGGLMDGLATGTKLAVVDPRYSVAASKSDWWLPIRPGTDTALLLSWIHLLIEKNLYDKEYVEAYGQGFEELARHVKPYTPEWAQEHTGLPADFIREIAEEMGRAKPAVVIHPGRQTTWYGNDTQRARAMAILTGLLGAWGREGGLFYPSPIKLGKCPCDPREDPSQALCLHDQYHFRDEGMPAHCIIENSMGAKPAVRAWWVWGQNLLQSAPNPQRSIQALKNLEFVCVTDILPSEIAQFADILLPESTYLERFDGVFAVRHAVEPFIALRQPLVPPLHNTKDGFSIVKGVMNAMGRKDCLPCDTIEEYIDLQLKPADLSLEELMRKGVVPTPGRPYRDKPKFYTPSKKIEFFSQELAKRGHPPMPIYQPPEKNPKGSLRLVSGRTPYHTFARSMNNKLLHAHAPENPVVINAAQGRGMGLKDGDRVQLENTDGLRSREGRVQLNPGIRPGLVYTWHGFGVRSPDLKTAFKSGFSDNFLMTRFAVDPETGATGMRVNFVKLVRTGKTLDAPEVDDPVAALRRERGKAASRKAPTKPVTKKAAPALTAPVPDDEGPPPGGC